MRLWNLHWNLVNSGRAPSLASLFAEEKIQSGVLSFGFSQQGVNQRRVEWLRNLLAVLAPEPANPGERKKLMEELVSIEVQEQKLYGLSLEFWDAIEGLNVKRCQAFIDSGFPINFQHPKTGLTPLHLAAAGGVRSIVRMLVNSGRCDYLLRDKSNRLAVDTAYAVMDREPAVARLLFKKTWQQAIQRGLDARAVLTEYKLSL